MSENVPAPRPAAAPVATPPKRLASSRVVIQAPMSFTGSFKRARNWFRGWLFWVIGVPLILAWWCAIVCWYVVFGLFLAPYRLIRRGSRKRKLADLRHQEMLAAIQRRP